MTTPRSLRFDINAPLAAAGALPGEDKILAYYDFESTENLTAVEQKDWTAESGLTGTEKYEIVPSEHPVLFANGPVGQCAYVDGTYGLKFDELPTMTDDGYTSPSAPTDVPTSTTPWTPLAL